MDSDSRKLKISLVAIQLFILLSIISCTPFWTAPPITQSSKYAIHICKTGDTFEKLSLINYGERDKAWIIREFNDKERISAGDEIIIPLIDVSVGGIRPWGYQVVPILCYNQLATGANSKTAISVDSFEKQMAFLKDKGYFVISLEDFFNFLNYNSPIPEKSTVITFDGGWKSFYELAYPILKHYGFTATLFIPTDFISASLVNTPYSTMSWKSLYELGQNGFDIQSKTKTHVKLARKKDETYPQYQKKLLKEFSESKKAIEKRIKKPVKFLAYPYNALNADVIAMAKKAGYEGGLTTIPGQNPFFVCNFSINRIIITQENDLESFASELRHLEKVNLTGYKIIP
ncbi:MAG: polysaccharide deacetylase family protein [Deltaproteobacteria bacterium]|nr:polysaccharide deacetylase family protein [Deltaproteobacteria bacterium]